MRSGCTIGCIGSKPLKIHVVILLAFGCLGMSQVFAEALPIAAGAAGEPESEVPGAAAQDAAAPATRETPGQRDDGTIEEVMVYGERKKDYIHMDPVRLGRIRQDHGKGAQLYRRKQYDRAYPLLLAAAQEGFKLSQARVGFILQQGLGGVKRDGRAAIGWLGVAASPTSTPEIRKHFEQLIEKIPEARHGEVEQIVQEYIAQYGTAATGIHCDNERLAGTHNSRLKCDHKDEFRYRDILDDMDNAAGVTESGGSGVPD